MSIKRAPRPKTNFTIITNAVLRDENLSFRARGVLACILSRPDNWKTTAESLARESKEGRSAILTTLKELEAAGYMKRTKYRNEKGQWVWESFVYDTPQAETKEPESKNPPTDKPTSGEPSTEIQTLIEEPIKNERKEERDTRTYGDENHQACNLLADLIAENGSRRPQVTDKWLSDMERLHRIDERSWEQITKAIEWCQADDFWRGNIMSPGKLRKQYDQLRLAAQRNTKQSKFTKTMDWLKNLENETKELEQ
jgi:DNA-binding MarR family transcriptional regulator